MHEDIIFDLLIFTNSSVNNEQLNYSFRFFKDMVVLSDDFDAVPTASPAERLDDLAHLLRMRVHKKRAVQKVDLNLGQDVKIALSVYNMIQRATKPSKVTILDPLV